MADMVTDFIFNGYTYYKIGCFHYKCCNKTKKAHHISIWEYKNALMNI